jgi:hypothetical protein
LKYDILYPEKAFLAIAGTAKKPIKIGALAHFRNVLEGFPSKAALRARTGRIRALQETENPG